MALTRAAREGNDPLRSGVDFTGLRRDLVGMDDITRLQEQIAHLTHTVDDLSDVVARQERDIALLTARVARLVEREAEREAAETGGVVLGDERPPHW